MNVFQFGSFSLEESRLFQYPQTHGGKHLPNGNGTEHVSELQSADGVEAAAQDDPKSSYQSTPMPIQNLAIMVSDVPQPPGYSVNSSLVVEQPAPFRSSSERLPEGEPVKSILQVNGGFQVQGGPGSHIMRTNQEQSLGPQESSYPAGPASGAPTLSERVDPAREKLAGPTSGVPTLSDGAEPVRQKPAEPTPGVPTSEPVRRKPAEPTSGVPTPGAPTLSDGAGPAREMARDQRGTVGGTPPPAVGPAVLAGSGTGSPSGATRKGYDEGECAVVATPKGTDSGEAGVASSSGAGVILPAPPPKPAVPRSWADLVGVQEPRRQGHLSSRSTHAASPSISRPWQGPQAVASVSSGPRSSSVPASSSTSSSSSSSWSSSSTSARTTPTTTTTLTLTTAPALPLSGSLWLERLQSAEGAGGGPYVRPRGLLNTGNSCFLNATLQALLSLPPFLQLLMTLRTWQLPKDCPTLIAFSKLAAQFESVPGSEIVGTSGEATSAAAAAAAEFSPRPNVGRPLAPDFAEVLQRFTPGQPAHPGGGRTSRQEDAQEFLSFVMDCMHEELLQLENAQTTTTTTRGTPTLGREANGGGSSSSGAGTITTAGGENVISISGGGGGGNDSREKESFYFDGASAGSGNNNNNNSSSNDSEEWETVGPKNKTALTRTHEEAQSALRDIFGGQLKSVIKCKGSKPSATVQPFLLLQLDVLQDTVHTVEDALHLYVAPEMLDGYKGGKLQQGGQSEVVPAYKHVRFMSLPRVLVLHLMRFTYGAGGTGKVHKPIHFKEVLVVGKELMASTVGKTPETRRYELVATVSHHGKDPSGGHYTADTKQHNGQWLRFDDGNVSAIPLSRVLHDQAYLLVYKRHS